MSIESSDLVWVVSLDPDSVEIHRRSRSFTSVLMTISDIYLRLLLNCINSIFFKVTHWFVKVIWVYNLKSIYFILAMKKVFLLQFKNTHNSSGALEWHFLLPKVNILCPFLDAWRSSMISQNVKNFKIFYWLQIHLYSFTIRILFCKPLCISIKKNYIMKWVCNIYLKIHIYIYEEYSRLPLTSGRWTAELKKKKKIPLTATCMAYRN